MVLQSHFDVAHLVGHPAFDHLALAMDVYAKAGRDRLFDLDQHSWPDCLSAGARLDSWRREELKWCVHAVIFFQSMMEKVPYFVPTIGSGMKPTTKGGFAASWRDLLNQITDGADRTAALGDFSAFHTAFYKALRNPIIHGRDEGDIRKVNLIRVPDVYAGMERGWRAYDYLLAEAFAPERRHHPSWPQMCQSHQIPETLDLSLHPDLEDMARRFMRKHLDGARATSDGS